MTMELTFRIILGIVIVLIAIVSGLLLRRLLLKRFQRGSLTHALMQAVSVSMILLLFLLAISIDLVLFTGNTSLFALLLGAKNPNSNQTSFQNVINTLWNISLTGFICLLGLIVAGRLKIAVVQRLDEQQAAINLRALMGRAVYVLVLIAVFFIVLSIWNVQAALPAAVVTGVLTFALQDLIKDLVAGTYILAEHQFQIGDDIEINKLEGTVTSINIRATTLRLFTGEEMIVPNGRFLDSPVSNITRYRERRAAIQATFAQEDYEPKQTALQLAQTIKGMKVVDSGDEPLVTFFSVQGRVAGYLPQRGGYTSKTVTLSVRFWVESRDRHAVTSVMERLMQEFPQADFLVQEFAGEI